MRRPTAKPCDGADSRVRAREAGEDYQARGCWLLSRVAGPARVRPQGHGVYVDKGVLRALQGYEAQVRTETR